MAIVLWEEGLYDKCRIYATDMNETAIQQAQKGIFPLERMREYTDNYLSAGGKRSFSEYYTARYGNAIFRSDIRRNLMFSSHNLASDSSFNEFNAILCRNVIIYFDQALQIRAHDLFYQSLSMFGFMILGKQESIKFTPHESRYEVVDNREKIYRKVR